MVLMTSSLRMMKIETFHSKEQSCFKLSQIVGVALIPNPSNCICQSRTSLRSMKIEILHSKEKICFRLGQIGGVTLIPKFTGAHIETCCEAIDKRSLCINRIPPNSWKNLISVAAAH